MVEFFFKIWLENVIVNAKNLTSIKLNTGLINYSAIGAVLLWCLLNSWRMKNLGKIHFPDLHLNPINRDLFVIISLAMLVALAIVTVGVMLISQI